MITVVIGLVRTKLAAIYLGTLGVGLLGTYASIIGMIGTLAGMGIGSSGVRQIAEATTSGDAQRVAKTLLTIRRVALVLGVVGMSVMAVMARAICQWTFGDAKLTVSLVVLAATVLLGAVATGQAAIVQGLRRIPDLARINVVGAMSGAAIAIPLMVGMGLNSIVPMMLASSGLATLIAWHYARKIELPEVNLSWLETCQTAVPLLTLGSAFASSVLMANGVAYLTQVMIIRRLDLNAAGLYSAAWSLSNFSVGFILGAMGADFFPRLTAVSNDDAQVNRLVNEQTEVSLLLALPGVIALITLAPWIFHVLYSATFLPAVDVLRWQVLGLNLRVLSWPMGFILLAKGNVRLVFWSEFVSSLVHLSLTWCGIVLWGLKGAGAAFVGLYVFHTILMAFVSRRLTGFRWTAANGRLIAWGIPTATGAFVSAMFLPAKWSLPIGLVLAVVSASYSLRSLTRLTGGRAVASFLLRMRAMCGGPPPA